MIAREQRHDRLRTHRAGLQQALSYPMLQALLDHYPIAKNWHAVKRIRTVCESTWRALETRGFVELQLDSGTPRRVCSVKVTLTGEAVVAAHAWGLELQ